MVKYNFRNIHVVPSAENCVDIMLSKTNRQTPTVVRARWKISRIRQFYMRKVRFTQQNLHTRLTQIIEQFPNLSTIHPFYADMINVLYDRDHYKLALGQLNHARGIIDNIGRDYVKLLKYGDSLYRCKQLKRAALGRMVKVVRQQKAAFAYLERVRQHLARLPTIDPHTRTLLLTGFPNAGKSSFMNKVTRAQVDVQSYAFTTKSLYVGHCDHKYLRWQIIDSPGVLDRPLEERNNIEMQAITALAHLNACVIFFLDLSPNCDYTIKHQCHLFKSLSPLFTGKPVVIVANKIDLRPVEQLSPEERHYIEEITNFNNVHFRAMSVATEEGVIGLRDLACDLLLAHRVEVKAHANKLSGSVADRLFIAYPQKRDDKERPRNIPPTVLEEWALRKAGIKVKKPKRRTEKDIQEERGGAGKYGKDIRLEWQLKNPEHAFDHIPEIINGKNIADLYDPNIMDNLERLENEEIDQMVQDRIEQDDPPSDLDEDDKLLYGTIVDKQRKAKEWHGMQAKMRSSRPQMSRVDKPHSIQHMEGNLQDLGIDTSRASNRARSRERSRSKHRGLSREMGMDVDSDDDEDMEVSTRGRSRTPRGRQQIARENSRGPGNRSSSRARSKSKPREPAPGTGSMTASNQAHKLMKSALKQLHQQGRVHESDHRNDTRRPKHLFAGKMNLHKRDRR